MTDRYRMVAYVCEGGIVYPARTEGSVLFRNIVWDNHHSCRFAVVTVLREVRAYDLNEILFGAALEPYPGPYRVYPTADAAIMGCALLDHQP
jgi:hypothetical protein